jgi:hypothetical protein
MEVGAANDFLINLVGDVIIFTKLCNSSKFFNSCNIALSSIKFMFTLHIQLPFFFLIDLFELLFPIFLLEIYGNRHQVIYKYA